MNRPIIKLKLSELESVFAKLAIAAAKRPPVKNFEAAEEVLLKFGNRIRDAHMQRDVIKFDSLELCNAARYALSGSFIDVLPPECSSADELLAFFRDDVLFWLALGTKVGDATDGDECHYINLMFGDEIGGHSQAVA